jgi:hypothetical protein
VSAVAIGDNDRMPARPVGTRRPRLLPGALFASGLVVAAACTALAATAGPDRQSVQTCSTGQQWVTVQPLVVGISQWQSAKGAAAGASGPSMAGCLDTRHLTPKPATPTDSRG